MSKYCIYLRKSRADIEAEAHGEGETLLRHRSALLNLAKKMGITVSTIYEEIASGETIAARPQMQRLLAEVAAKEWDGVLVMEIERLARGDTMDQGYVAQTFKFSGTKIITPSKTFDPSNEYDEEYFEFGLFMARREFTAINRRLVRGREASAREGKYVGSIPPYGYRKVKIPNDKGYTLEIDEGQAQVVRMVFGWYIDGAIIDGQRKRLGPYAIAMRLNELGIQSARGKDYWTIYGVKNMLTNPVYIGKIRWGYRKAKKVVTPEGRKKTREFSRPGDYIVVDGLHDPILTDETFARAQELIADNPPPPIKMRSKCVNPFAGLIYCGKCGHSIIYRPVCGRHADAYLCCNTAGCNNVSAPFALVEQRVLTALHKWVEDYSVDNIALEQTATLGNELDSAIAAASKETETLQAQLDNVYDYFERGIYPQALFKTRSARIGQQIADLKAKIDKLRTEQQQLAEQQTVQAEFVPSVCRLLDAYSTLSAAEKNEWLKQIIERMIYTKDVRGSHNGAGADCFTLGISPRLARKD